MVLKSAKTTLLLAGLLGPTMARAGILEQIGYTDLIQRDSAVLAQGAGVSVEQVEVPEAGAASPDLSASDFAGKTITGMVAANAFSAHATTVAADFYGNTAGVAPNVHKITIQDVDSFIGRRGLNTTGNKLPVNPSVAVINNSWVGTYDDDAIDADALRRVDYMADHYNVVIVAAVDNSDAYPHLLASG